MFSLNCWLLLNLGLLQKPYLIRKRDNVRNTRYVRKSKNMYSYENGTIFIKNEWNKHFEHMSRFGTFLILEKEKKFNISSSRHALKMLWNSFFLLTFALVSRHRTSFKNVDLNMPKGGIHSFVNKLTRLKITPDKRQTNGTTIWLVKLFLNIRTYSFLFNF